MADFSQALAMTVAGSECLAAAQMGEKLTFTKIALGDGVLPPEVDPSEVTALYGPRAEVVPSIIEKVEPGNIDGDPRFSTIKVGGIYSNDSNLEGFTWRELGIFAKTDTHEECLYGYGNAGDKGESIPPSDGSQLVEKAIDVHIIVTPTAEPHLSIDSAFLVTTERLEQELDKLKTELGKSGKVHEADEAAKLKAAQNIQVNLASDDAASFDGTAEASPGVTGELSITHGGTGASTVEQARKNLGIENASAEASEGKSGLMSAEDKKKLDSIDTDKLKQLGELDVDKIKALCEVDADKLKALLTALSSGDTAHVLLSNGTSKDITTLFQENVETVRTSLGVVTKETDGLVPKLPENPEVEE